MSDCVCRSERKTAAPELDRIDRELILLTQAGLPLTAQPYHQLGEQLGISADDVINRLHTLLDCGRIRRIAAVPNHYRLGYTANGMTVWDVADEAMATLGPAVGALDFVSHCYRRPRHLPGWPYNLFAMAHGHNRDEVEQHRQQIRTLLGKHCRSDEVLYSTRILKKTGLRLNQTFAGD